MVEHPRICWPTAQPLAQLVHEAEFGSEAQVDPSLQAVHVAVAPEPESAKPAGQTLERVKPAPERTKLELTRHVETEPPAEVVPTGQGEQLAWPVANEEGMK
jgi:hypothetical protein